MSRLWLGVDIGNDAIHISVCKNGEIIDSILEPIPENLVKNGEIMVYDGMVEFLKTIKKKYKLKAKKVSLIMPSALCHLRRVTVPAMTTDQLMINLPYEFRDYIIKEKDKYFYDYAVVETIKDELGETVEFDLLACVALKTDVENYKIMFRQAGLQLVTVLPVELAYINVLRSYYHRHPLIAESGERGTCFVDLGYRSIRIYMFTEGKFIGMRALDYGCEKIVSCVADALNIDNHLAKNYLVSNYNDIVNTDGCNRIYSAISLEVMKAINYSSFNNQSWRPSAVYCIGGGAANDALVKTIEASTQLPAENVLQLMKVSPYSKEIQSVFIAAATGAAIQQGEKLW